MPFAKETTTSPPALRIALIRLTIAEPVSEPDPSQAGVQPPLPIGATTMAVPLATSAGRTLIAPSLGGRHHPLSRRILPRRRWIGSLPDRSSSVCAMGPGRFSGIDERDPAGTGPVHRGQRGGYLVQADRLRDEQVRAQYAGCDEAEQLRVGMRRHAVAAAQFQLVPDDPVQRQRRP